MEVSSPEQFLELTTGKTSDTTISPEEASRKAFKQLEENLEHKQATTSE